MKYTEKQKDLLLEKLFDGVVCLNIYRDIDIIHKSNNLSYYNTKTNEFWLNSRQILATFETNSSGKYQEIKELSEAILRDLTKRKGLTTHRTTRSYWRT